MKNRTLSWIVIGIFAVAFNLQGCAGASGLAGKSGSKRTYQKDYQSMKEVVENTVRESGLDIIEIIEPKDEDKMSLVISSSRFVDRQSIRQHEGMVIVQKISENKTSVEVENPEYHYTVPNYKREDYQRILFPKIEKKLGN